MILFSAEILLAGAEWQNSVDYKIEVHLDDKDHFLHGEERLTYYNNSPVTLDRIWLLLYPNTYKDETTEFADNLKKRNARSFHFSKEKDRGYISFESVTIDGERVNITSPNDSIDVGYIELEIPLKSGNSVSVDMIWTVKIPDFFSRFGHKGQHYEATQWYPKVAVFDENGWNPYPYGDIYEFYYEFGNFDVEVTLPDEYIVGATGDLISPTSEIARLDSLSKIGNRLMKLPDKQRKKEFEQISKSQKRSKNKKDSESPSSLKTLRYIAKNVHDFAWSADKDFIVQKGYFKYENQQDSIAIWNFFRAENFRAWKNTVETVQNTLQIYGSYTGPYPYSNVNVIESSMGISGGMEYPMLTLITPFNNAFLSETVVAHEVGHNWFYGILGFNENRHAWMDEGINTYGENRYVDNYIPEQEQNLLPGGIRFLLKDFNHLSLTRLTLNNAIAKNRDLPSNLPPQEYHILDYKVSIYDKPSIGLKLMEEYFGTEKFDRAMTDFYNTWKYRHPKPVDMELSFEKSLNEDLNWFFHDYLETSNKLDYRITEFSTVYRDNQWYTNVELENGGKLFTPCKLALYDKNERILEQRIFPTGDINTYKLNTDKEPSHAIIDPDFLTIDRDYSNNSSRYKILFEPIFNWGKPNMFQTFYSPLLNFNYMDGFQTGVILYRNNALPIAHHFRISLSYGFRSQRYLWTTRYSNNIYDAKSRKFNYGFKMGESIGRKYYSIFTKLSFPSKFQPGYDQSIEIKTDYSDIFDADLYDTLYWNTGIFRNMTASWKYSKNRFLSNLNTHIKLKIGSGNYNKDVSSQYIKTSLESSYKYRTGKNQLIKLRLYTGILNNQDNNLPKQEYFYANGGVDPSFEESFILDRTGKTSFSPMEHFYIRDGISLKGYQGLSGNSWAFGINAKYYLSNIFTFLDLGDVVNKDEEFENYFDLGVGLKFGPIYLYLPLYLNKPSDGFKKISGKKALMERWLIEISFRSIHINLG